MTILARAKGGARRTEARLVRLTPAELAAWKACLAPGESLSSMVRGAVEAERQRRREQAELAEKRQAEIAANPLARFDMLLEQAQRSA